MLLIKGLFLLSSLVISLIRCDSQFEPIICSSTKLLSPCRCFNDETTNGKIASINCTLVYSDIIDLKLISQQLEDVLFRGPSKTSGYTIDKLVIDNSAVKQIRSKVFTKISFNEIEIKDNKMLEFIDKNAFEGSIHTLKSFNIINNNRLYGSAQNEDEIWKLISKFTNLEELRIIGVSNLRSIPEHAFKPEESHRDFMHLKHVEITHNNIHSIGDFAFKRLTAPSLRLWLDHNKISTIGGNSLKFKKSPNHVIRLINLSNNLLTADSFDSQTFNNLGRPLATLFIRNNQIKSLPQSVFEPLFDRSEKSYFQLDIIGNPIECDCSLQWVVTTKYCYEENISTKLFNLIVEPKCGPNRTHLSLADFSSCEAEEKLSPSCLKGLNNSDLSLHKFNDSLFLTIVWFLIQLIYKINYS